MSIKMEDANLELFNMICLLYGVNESKTLKKHTSCESRCEFDGRKCNSTQKWNNDKRQYECKKLIIHRACEENFVWNRSTCRCKYHKDCDISKYLKDCESMKGFADGLLVTCDEINNIPKNAGINPIDGINYWLVAFL